MNKVTMPKNLMARLVASISIFFVQVVHSRKPGLLSSDQKRTSWTQFDLILRLI